MGVADPEQNRVYAPFDLNRDGYVTGEALSIHLRTEVTKSVTQSSQYRKILDYWFSRVDYV